MPATDASSAESRAESGGVPSARAPRGCQVWFEPDDAPDRVDMLFAQAAGCGLGWACLFLMWPCWQV